MIENIAEADDALVERYLEGESLSEEDLKNALRKRDAGTDVRPRAVRFVDTGNIGIDLLMDFMVAAMPSRFGDWAAPEQSDEPGNEGRNRERHRPAAPFSALVVKTITDPYAGRLTIFRVFSGSIGADGSFYNVEKRSARALQPVAGDFSARNKSRLTGPAQVPLWP